jgi:5-methylthioribose kinase
MDAVQKLMKKGIKMVLKKCLPDIYDFFQEQFERVYSGDYNKKVFNKFIKECIYFRFGLGPYPEKPPTDSVSASTSLDEILEKIAFEDMKLCYTIKTKFFEFIKEYNLNLDGLLDDLYIKYMS